MTGDVANDLSWAPQRSVFIRRALIVSSFTFGLFALAAAYPLFIGSQTPIMPRVLIAWVLPIALMFTIGYVFDDVLRWRSARLDRWKINDGHLIYEGLDGTAMVPLTDIRHVKNGIGSRVVISLISGKRIVMRYMPFPTETARQIEAARHHL